MTGLWGVRRWWEKGEEEVQTRGVKNTPGEIE